MGSDEVGWRPEQEDARSDKYTVDLTAAEQEYLGGLLKYGKASARKIARAHMLLHAAEGLSDADIADTLRVGLSTIHRIRQRFVEGSVPAGDMGGCKVLRIPRILHHRIQI